MTYERLLKTESIRCVRTFENGDTIWNDNEKYLEYLVRDKEIIALGYHVWSFANMDYETILKVGSTSFFTILKREGTILYTTETGEYLNSLSNVPI